MDNTNQQPLSPQQPIEQVSAPLPSSGPSKTFIILIVLILITAFGVGGYFLGANQQNQVAQNQTQPVPPITQPSPIPTADPTSEWKTYTNTEYGYSFKYPSEWSSKEISPYSDELARQEFRDITIDLEMIVSIQKDKVDGERLKTLGINQVQINKNYGQINGTLYRTRGTGVGGSLYRQDFIFSQKEYHFWFILNTAYKDPNTTQTEVLADKVFDQILSTFQFSN